MKRTVSFLVPLLTAGGLAATVSSSQAVLAYGLTVNGLVSFDTGNPSVTLSTSAFSGLAGGDVIVDIDYRPSDGQLYAMASSGRLYTVDAASGSAVVSTSAGVGALGAVADIDFNPAADRLRIFSAGDANYRLTPGSGTVTGDGTMAYLAGDINAGINPNLAGAAYTNNFPSPATTVLYSLDADLNSLVRHSGPAAFSELNTVAGLTIGGLQVLDIGLDTGFDIYTGGGTDWAFLTSGNALYQVDLGTGEATPLGDIGIGGSAITSLAVVPEPGAALLAALPLGGLLRRRRQV